VVVSDQSGHFSGPLVGIFLDLFSKWSFFAVFVVSSEKSCWLRGRKKLMIISSKEKYYCMMIVFLNSCFENLFLCQKKE